jgi:hypothetical protein
MATAVAMTGFCANAADESTRSAEESVDRVPKIHGVFRGRYEGSWDDYASRFQVRNARVSLEGQVLKNLDYYFRIDLCDRGTMKFLDGWARWKFNSEWAVKVGRYRVPFGVDAFRGPGTYIFANRSFIGKETANLRQVGVQFGYYGKKIPLTVEAGVFNSSTTSQEGWQKELDYAAKASYRIGNVTLSASFLSMDPKGVRMNFIDGAIGYKVGNFAIDGEYQHIDYVNNAYKDANAWLVAASYGIPVDWKPVNLWSFHGRVDAVSDFSTGTPDADGFLTDNLAARVRTTFGTSFACNVIKSVKAELILDYEHYFHDKDVSISDAGDNRIVAELVVKF